MVAQKRRRDPGDVEGLEVGAKVSKRFPGYGAAPWEGTVTRIDVDASRFAVAWAEGDETWYAFRLARKMLEDAAGPAGARGGTVVAGDPRLRRGAAVKKKFVGYGAELWAGRVTRVDAGAGTFVVTWEDDAVLTHAIAECGPMLDAAAPPAAPRRADGRRGRRVATPVPGEFRLLSYCACVLCQEARGLTPTTALDYASGEPVLKGSPP